MPDGQTPQLPPDLGKLLDEVAVIEAKLSRVGDGVPTDDVDAAKEAFEGLKGDVGLAMLEEARREIADAKAKANAIAAGEARPAVDPGPDQKAIAEVEQELQRIRDKLAKARENDASDAQVKGIEAGLEQMKKALREAALAAARRELAEARKRAQDIKKGNIPPPPPPPNGGGPGPIPPMPNPAGGGGGNGGSDDDSDGSSGAGLGGATTTEEARDPLRIFVRSNDTVWAWSRRDQAWIRQDFDSELIEVKLIEGGIFAIAKMGAALFDVLFGRWLTLLDTGGETLIEGDA